ncbi:MAG: hypothetical protein JWR77_2386 [Rhizorhabdus sp.]|nr:hypothetical protein [Rhizorhabdus sp.]
MTLLTSLRMPFMATCLLALAACSGGPMPRSGIKVASPTATTASEINAIAALLDQGDESAARRRLKVLLKREPMNASAQLLSDSIERDPKDLLGPNSYPYSVRAGDTITGLADRLLGNRLKSYQLLRYNGLKAPAALVAGQVLRIPGETIRIEPRRVEPTPVRPTPAQTTPRPKAEATRPAAPAPAANSIVARQLRAAGLTALNQGAIDRAVGLLRRAASLDPGNALISRDLARAERIAATVRSRR